MDPDTFEQARALFSDGMARFAEGDWAGAEQRLQASLRLLPGRASTLLNLGVTQLRLGRPQSALETLDAALATDPASADAWGHRGVALAELGRTADALAAFDEALARAPDAVAARWHRALALSMQHRHREALADLERVLQARPGDAPAWVEHGRTLQCLERHAEGITSYRRALALQPTLGEGWSLLGQALKDRDAPEEAAACFEQALAHGADAELNRWFLAGVRGAGVPDHAPAAYVQRLFDGYAADFDEHLVLGLQYQAPQVLDRMLAAAPAPRVAAALDLGCGTGLCAALLAARADAVDGVDLSATMIDRARALGRYRELVQADAAAFLARTDRRYGIVLAADSLIYIGALDGIFAGVRRVLESGGRFAFSVEAAAADVRYELRRSLRYAHGAAYLHDLALRHGLVWLAECEAPVRHDQGRPVPGFYGLLGVP